MNHFKSKPIPEHYKNALRKDQQGSILEVSYEVRNYIDSSRSFVTNQSICPTEVGREILQDEPITKKCNVYLPLSYNQNNDASRYPVLFLLHGIGGNRFEWLEGSGNRDGNFIICNILDHMIANGDISPIIVVFPEGRSSHDWAVRDVEFHATNVLGFYYFDYELRYDLIPYIEKNFRTISDYNDQTPEGIIKSRQHRGIAGLSMGGMQVLNLVAGGHRCDYHKPDPTESFWDNGLVPTVAAPGLTDLFAHLGAFSNAPTTSSGEHLGRSILKQGYPLHTFYINCGDADGISYHIGYERAITGLTENGKNYLMNYYPEVIPEGVHDFGVWNHGAYNFARLAFGKN